MKISEVLIGLIAVLSLVFSIVAINVGKDASTLGGTTNYDTLDVTDGYLVDGVTRISGSGGATFPSLTVTTSDSATSTAEFGCIETTATSTASPVKLVLGKVGSSATTTLYNTSSGAVYWAYGNCP
jgi:hypothetical protein